MRRLKVSLMRTPTRSEFALNTIVRQRFRQFTRIRGLGQNWVGIDLRVRGASPSRRCGMGVEYYRGSLAWRHWSILPTSPRGQASGFGFRRQNPLPYGRGSAQFAKTDLCRNGCRTSEAEPGRYPASGSASDSTNLRNNPDKWLTTQPGAPSPMVRPSTSRTGANSPIVPVQNISSAV